MELVVETYIKPDAESDQPSEEIGPSTLIVGESSYRILETIEEELKESGKLEKVVDLDESKVEIVEVAQQLDVVEPRIRVFMDTGIESALFHLVATAASDGRLIYTEPTLVRFTDL
jgi:hypothetical protein